MYDEKASDKQISYLTKLVKKAFGKKLEDAEKNTMTKKEASFEIQKALAEIESQKEKKELIAKYGEKAVEKYETEMKKLSADRTLSKFVYLKCNEVAKLYKGEKDENVKALYRNFCVINRCEDCLY